MTTGAPADAVPGLLALRPRLEHRAWGDPETIHRLLGSDPDGRPVAELWIGGYPGRGALTADGTPLDELLAAAGEPALDVLVKVLTVASPLSLQLHPDDEAAERGHAAGLAGFADPRGKPELLLARTPFSSLSGLRPPADALQVLDLLGLAGLPGWEPVVTALRGGDVRTALGAVLAAGRDLSAGLAAVLGADAAVGAADLGAARRVTATHADDPAVAATLLLQPHELAPGQTLWCPAGCPHLHVSGSGVEVQTSADTTLRAGLTAKPVDTGRFLEHLGTRTPLLLAPAREGAEEVVTAPDGRLRLGVVSGAGVLDPLPVRSLLLCGSGSVTVRSGGATIGVAAGHGALVGARTGPLEVSMGTADGVLFRASTLGPTG